jgi:hypothetical protein
MRRKIFHFQSAGGAQEQGIDCDFERRQVCDSGRYADLSFAGAQQGFFLAEVQLDLPSPGIILNHLLKAQVGIGADQIGGIAIEQFPALGRPISERSDDNEPAVVPAGIFPAAWGDGFDLESMDAAGGECLDCNPWYFVVLPDLFRGWDLFAAP